MLLSNHESPARKESHKKESTGSKLPFARRHFQTKGLLTLLFPRKRRRSKLSRASASIQLIRSRIGIFKTPCDYRVLTLKVWLSLVSLRRLSGLAAGLI